MALPALIDPSSFSATASEDPPRPGEIARACLLVLEREALRVLPLPTAGALVLGRGPEADLRLDDPRASRRHARVIVCDGAVRVSDLGSRNGTRLNGEPLAGGRALEAGDVISIGEVVIVAQFRAHLPAVAAPEAAHRVTLGEHELVLADPVMLRLYELIRKLARSELPVLVRGETGAGKENAAFAVHHFSRRTGGPFVTLNCAALQDTLVESELFGHERGAFSGAATTKPGLLEAACGGTVFLDEVGELGAAAQAKLLRALEARRITRLGDVRERAIDIRIVAATNRDLAEEIRAGRFRQDLFFRLSAASVVLPPLRERPLEIPVLARTFLARACERLGRKPPELGPAALTLLGARGWPGNVRELRNVMDYVAATVSTPEVEAWQLPEALLREGAPSEPSEADTTAPPWRPLTEEVRALERSRMLQALEATGGVQTRAAELIGMPVRTFAWKLKQYGLRARPRSAPE